MGDHPPGLPPSPEDDDARRDALMTIAKRVVLWTVPVIALALLALALGVPWWLVGVGVAAFVAFILFEA